MKNTRLVIAAALAALVASTPAVGQVKIGVSLAATGPAAALGIPEKNTFALLPTQIAGQTVEYIVLDDATDPSAGSRNARKLVSEDHVDVIVGSSATPASVAIAEVANETGTPQIAMAPVTLPEEKNRWVFRTPQHNRVMASALVAHMKGAGVKSLGFIGYSDAYGEDWLNALKPQLEAAGIKLGPVERYNRTDTSVGGQVLKLFAARPDAVLVVGSGSPAALPQTALAERGYKGQIYQTHAAANPAFLKVAGKAADGAIMPIGPVVVADQIADSHPSKKVAESFVRAYEEKYGARSFSSFAGHAYDAYLILEHAIPVALKSARPGTAEFRAALRDAIENGGEVVGTHGVFAMKSDDHFGLDERARVLIRVDNGAYKLVAQ